MEPLPSGQAGKKTSAEIFDEAQANRRNACFLEMARYLGDVEARLRREDFRRFGRALAAIHEAEVEAGDVESAKAAAVLIISGDKDLVGRFEEFLRGASVVSRGLP